VHHDGHAVRDLTYDGDGDQDDPAPDVRTSRTSTTTPQTRPAHRLEPASGQGCAVQEVMATSEIKPHVEGRQGDRRVDREGLWGRAEL
jgi:hypothetical protein